MAKIQVAIRVRALIQKELDAGNQNQWQVENNTITCLEAGKKSNSFTFDHVFDRTALTIDIFEAVARPIADAAVDGFNGTVFAYGQSSSGKTFTMTGSPFQPGVITLAVQEIFQKIENIPKWRNWKLKESVATSFHKQTSPLKIIDKSEAIPDREFLIRIGYMEIYNEKVSDLLKDDNILKIQEDTDRNVSVVGLHEEIVKDTVEVLNVIKKGDTKRHTAETKENARSSRSHAILRFVIESRAVGHEDDAVKVSNLFFVDLAGSEKAGENTGERFREGCLINRSLFTLGMVIRALSGDSSQQHVSLRDSKLTRILTNALGGNSMTAIICTITPARVEESINTLRFASHAKQIKNEPKVNEVMSEAAMLRRYQQKVRELEKKISEMNDNMVQIDRMELEKQKETIDKLKAMIVTSGTGHAPAPQAKKRRRETWCGQKMKRPRASIMPDIPEVPQELTLLSDVPMVKNISSKKQSLERRSDEHLQILEFVDEAAKPQDETIFVDNSVKDMFALQDKHELLLEEFAKKERELNELEEFTSLEREAEAEEIKCLKEKIKSFEHLEEKVKILEQGNPWLEEELFKVQQERNSLRQKVEAMNLKLEAANDGSGITDVTKKLGISETKTAELTSDLEIQKSRYEFHIEQMKKQLESYVTLLEENGINFEEIKRRNSLEDEIDKTEVNSKHEQELTELRDEIDMLMISVEKEKKEKREIEKSFEIKFEQLKKTYNSDLKESREITQIYHEESLNMKKQYEQELMQLREELNSIKMKSLENEDEIADSQKEGGSDKRVRFDFDTEIERLKDRITELTEERDVYKNMLETSVRDVSVARDTCTTVESSPTTDSAGSLHRETLCAEMEDAKVKHEQEIETNGADSGKDWEALYQEEKLKNKKLIEVHAGEIEYVKEECRKFVEENFLNDKENVEDEIRQYKEEVERLKSQLHIKVGEACAENLAVDGINNQHREEYEKTMQDCQTELQTMREDIQKLYGEIELLQGSNKKLRQEKITLTNAGIQAEEEIKGLQEKVKNLQKTLLSVENKVDSEHVASPSVDSSELINSPRDEKQDIGISAISCEKKIQDFQSTGDTEFSSTKDIASANESDNIQIKLESLQAEVNSLLKEKEAFVDSDIEKNLEIRVLRDKVSMYEKSVVDGSLEKKVECNDKDIEMEVKNVALIKEREERDNEKSEMAKEIQYLKSQISNYEITYALSGKSPEKKAEENVQKEDEKMFTLLQEKELLIQEMQTKLTDFENQMKYSQQKFDKERENQGKLLHISGKALQKEIDGFDCNIECLTAEVESLEREKDIRSNEGENGNNTQSIKDKVTDSDTSCVTFEEKSNEEFDEMQVNIDVLLVEIRDQRKENDELRTVLDKKEIAIDELQSKLANYERQPVSWQQETEKMKEIISIDDDSFKGETDNQYTEKIEIATREQKSFIISECTSENETRDMCDKIKTLIAEINTLKQEKELWQKVGTVDEGEIQNLEDKLANSEKCLSKSEENNMEELEEMRASMDVLLAEISDQKKENDELRTLLDNKEMAMHELQSKLIDYDRQSVNWQQETEMKKEIIAMDDDSCKGETSNHNTEENDIAAREQKSFISSECTSENETRHMCGRMKTLVEEINALKQEKELWQKVGPIDESEIQDIKEKLSHSDDCLAKSEEKSMKELEEMQASMDVLLAEISDQRKQNDELRILLDNKEMAMHELQSKLVEYEKQSVTWQQETETKKENIPMDDASFKGETDNQYTEDNEIAAREQKSFTSSECTSEDETRDLCDRMKTLVEEINALKQEKELWQKVRTADESEIQDLKDKLANSEVLLFKSEEKSMKELVEIQATMDVLLAEIKVQKDEKDDMINMINEKDRTAEELQTKLIDAGNQFVALQQESESQREKMQINIENLQKEILALKKEIEVKSNTEQLLISSKDTFAMKIEEMQYSIDILQEEMITLKKERELAQLEERDKEITIQDLKDRLANAEISLLTSEERMKKEVEEIQASNDVLYGEITILRKEKEDILFSINEKETALLELKTELIDSQKQFTSSQEELEKLQNIADADRANLLKEINSLKQEIEIRESLETEKNQKIDELQQKLRHYHETSDIEQKSLQTTLKDMQARTEVMRKEITSLNNEKEQLKQIQIEKENRIVELQEKNDSQDASKLELEEMRSNIEMLLKEVDSMRKTNRILSDAKNAAETKLAEITTSESHLKMKLDNIVQQIQDTSAEESKPVEEMVRQLIAERDSLKEDIFQMEHNNPRNLLKGTSLPEDTQWETKWEELIRAEKRKRMSLHQELHLLKKKLQAEQKRCEEAMEHARMELQNSAAQEEPYKKLRELFEVANADANNLNAELLEEREITAGLREKIQQLEEKVDGIEQQKTTGKPAQKQSAVVDWDHTCKYKLDSYSTSRRLKETQDQLQICKQDFEENVKYYKDKIAGLKNDMRRQYSEMDNTYDLKSGKPLNLGCLETTPSGSKSSARNQASGSQTHDQSIQTDDTQRFPSASAISSGVVDYYKVCYLEAENKELKRDLEKMKRQVTRLSSQHHNSSNCKENQYPDGSEKKVTGVSVPLKPLQESETKSNSVPETSDKKKHINRISDLFTTSETPVMKNDTVDNSARTDSNLLKRGNTVSSSESSTTKKLRGRPNPEVDGCKTS